VAQDSQAESSLAAQTTILSGFKTVNKGTFVARHLTVKDTNDQLRSEGI
jgi:hypothetical protein